MKKPLVILSGPTAVGKTALSVNLAKVLDAEIISADSMQVYRHMNIGTDKITPFLTEGIPHHLIDVLEPTEPFDAHTFQKMALSVMEDIYSRGKIPLIVGGTGFYIRTVLYRTDFTETSHVVSLSLRSRFEKIAAEDGAKVLHEMLQEVDPISAERIPAANVKRVVRALEYHAQTGEPISAHNDRERAKPSPYEFRYFVLTDDRALLYERINYRVDKMIRAGLIEETMKLKEMGVTRSMTSMQALGYREISAYLDGLITRDRAIDLIKRNTRHFAKRQMTWFRREKDAELIDLSAFDRDHARILRYLTERCEPLIQWSGEDI